MTSREHVERLLARLEDIRAIDANIDEIERIEGELMDALRSADVGDLETRELTERAIDTMTGVSARLALETATVEDFTG
ncbi:MAG TPA: hypothetical protein VK816_09550 [Jatrophihabitantaceae bacterium]|nr:hypothetical protein [Jatrophihabitantaceae bacterium]